MITEKAREQERKEGGQVYLDAVGTENGEALAKIRTTSAGFSEPHTRRNRCLVHVMNANSGKFIL